MRWVTFLAQHALDKRPKTVPHVKNTPKPTNISPASPVRPRPRPSPNAPEVTPIRCLRPRPRHTINPDPDSSNTTPIKGGEATPLSTKNKQCHGKATAAPGPPRKKLSHAFRHDQIRSNKHYHLRPHLGKES